MTIAECFKNVLRVLSVIAPWIIAFGTLVANAYFDRRQERRQNRGRAYELLLSSIDETAEVLFKNPEETDIYAVLSTKTSRVNIWASKDVYKKTEEVIDTIFDVHNYMVDYFNKDIIREVDVANKELKELRGKYAEKYNSLVQQMRKELGSGEGAAMTFSTRELKELKAHNIFSHKPERHEAP